MTRLIFPDTDYTDFADRTLAFKIRVIRVYFIIVSKGSLKNKVTLFARALRPAKFTYTYPTGLLHRMALLV